MVKNFRESLAKLRNTSVQASPGGAYPEPGCASVQLIFGNGTRLHTQYWRITEADKPSLTSFDHQQEYGLPAPIDSIKEFQERLQDKLVSDASLLERSGDLLFEFAGDIKLEVFAFSGYEDWEIHFPDGSGEYSNYLR